MTELAPGFEAALEQAHTLSPWVVAYSGGKDSTALFLWARRQRHDVVAVFCDTGAEWLETYHYLDYIEKELCLNLVRLGYPGGLEALIRATRMFPSAVQRFCTSKLKTRVIGKWLRDYPNGVLLMGQRWQESVKRAGLPAWSEVGTFKTNEIKVPIFRPLLHWSKAEVLAYIRQAGVKLNPVYHYTTRANCGVCCMASTREVGQFCRRHPEQAEAFLALERELGKPWRMGVWLRDVAEKSLNQLPLFDWDSADSCFQDGFCDLGDVEQ